MKKQLYKFGRVSYVFETTILMALIVQQAMYDTFSLVYYFPSCLVLIVLIILSVPEGAIYKKFKEKP